MERKKIIILGSNGNVGSYLTLYALDFFNKDEYEVIASGRRDFDFWTRQGVPYVKVDITKKEDFENLPKDNVYAVMLLSAQLPAYMDVYEPQKYIDINITGALNVLEYCRQVKADRIIYTQTFYDIAKYPKDRVIDPYDARNFSYTGDHAVYVISKCCALDLLEHYRQEYGLKKFVFRLPAIYSYTPDYYYYPDGVKTMRPFYKQIFRAINGEPLELWGNPENKRDMVHVYDFSQMLCKAVLVNREEGIYNVGTGNPVTLEQQMKAMIDVFSPADKKSEIVYLRDKPSGPGFIEMDVTNAKEQLGYKPQYDVYKLLENFKEEMEVNRFKELRLK